MEGILFVHGGRRRARRIFAEEGRADWAQALRVVLEKHGYLQMDEAGPEALSDPERLRRYAAVLVARLDDSDWGPEALATIVDGDVPALVEGPLPEALNERLGVTLQGTIEEEGGVMVVEPGLRAGAAEFGAALGAALSMPRSSAVELDPALHWSRLPGVPIDDRLANCWRAQAWDVARWKAERETTVLCDWVSRSDPADRHPAIVRRGHVAGCSFGLFAYLVQRHTCEPYAEGEWLSTERSLGLEAILLGLIDEMHRRSDSVRVRVLPWPAGVSWVRTVRYDAGPTLPEETLRALSKAHSEAGHAVTWFWPPRDEDGERPAVLENSERCELARSEDRFWARPKGALRGVTDDALGTGSRSSSSSFRWQGAPNVLWAEREGFRYTEFLGRANLHPHRFPSLDPDGAIAPLDIICLPHYEALHWLSRDPKRMGEVVSLWSRAGGALQFLRRPDPPSRKSFASIAVSDEPGRGDWTAAEIAEWWRRTHVSGRFRIRSLGQERYEVVADEPVEHVVLEFRHPDGRRTQHAVDAGPAGVTVDQPARRRTGPVSWDETHSAYTRAIRHLSVAEGTPVSREAQLSLDNNTRAIPARGELLLDLLSEFGQGDINGATVLDCGCGFGGVASYLAWRAEPGKMIASDVDPRLLTIGEQIAEELGLGETLHFLHADMRTLDPIPSGSIDVVLANGVLMYARSGVELSHTLRAFRRVLVPGGSLLVYHTNKWSPRDPENDRLRLPGRSDKRWISILEMRRRLKREGFADVSFVGYSSKRRHDRGPGRLLGRSYAAYARTPADAAPRQVGAIATDSRTGPAQLVDWQTASDRFGEVIREHNAERDIPAAALDSTIRTNTTLVPRRGDMLLDLLADLLGIVSLEHARILEAGCGYGALSAYLCWKGGARDIVALDHSPSYVEIAGRVIRELGMGDRVQVVAGDMRELPFEDRRFDLVIANNSLIYLPKGRDANAGLAEFSRVLAPGGGTLFYHANKWRLREPFTSDPVVHLLPAPLARLTVRLTGWKHNHGRVRLMSPPALRRALKRNGFEPTGTVGYGKGQHRSGLRRNFGTFYAQAARRTG